LAQVSVEPQELRKYVGLLNDAYNPDNPDPQKRDKLDQYLRNQIPDQQRQLLWAAFDAGSWEKRYEKGNAVVKAEQGSLRAEFYGWIEIDYAPSGPAVEKEFERLRKLT